MHQLNRTIVIPLSLFSILMTPFRKVSTLPQLFNGLPAGVLLLPLSLFARELHKRREAVAFFGCLLFQGSQCRSQPILPFPLFLPPASTLRDIRILPTQLQDGEFEELVVEPCEVVQLCYASGFVHPAGSPKQGEIGRQATDGEVTRHNRVPRSAVYQGLQIKEK